MKLNPNINLKSLLCYTGIAGTLSTIGAIFWLQYDTGRMCEDAMRTVCTDKSHKRLKDHTQAEVKRLFIKAGMSPDYLTSILPLNPRDIPRSNLKDCLRDYTPQKKNHPYSGRSEE